MSLAPGTRLGPYEITAQIGAGGMGEVYRARDTKLDRDVALKILPESFAGDPDRLMRFEREAKTLASLNHPHIAQIHGFEDRALVMELVEGEDLSQRIARGLIPIDEALPIAKQIAEALEAAHQQGIIHRDLKPANIKVRGDGTVKVLDFGLAKALDPGAGSREPGAGTALANSPTITSPAMTMHGMILGTAAYMSSEQARGKLVDKRADIWAFGVVFYEMLTGRRAFEGEDVSSILAAVIRSEPRWDGVPASVRRLLESCLEKDPKKRLRDIGDVWKLLDDQPAVATRTQSGILGWAAAGLLALLAAVALWAPWRDTPAPAVQPVLRLEADLGNEVSLVALIHESCLCQRWRSGPARHIRRPAAWRTLGTLIGRITAADGITGLKPGYDQYGYNYQAKMFNGLYENFYRPATPVTEGTENVIMKWSDEWLATVDCNHDGKLDRGLDPKTGKSDGASEGWVTNHFEGDYIGTDGESRHYTYFVKIAYGGAAQPGVVDPFEATRIWGQFAVIEEIQTDHFGEYGGRVKFVNKITGPGLGQPGLGQ